MSIIKRKGLEIKKEAGIMNRNKNNGIFSWHKEKIMNNAKTYIFTSTVAVEAKE